LQGQITIVEDAKSHGNTSEAGAGWSSGGAGHKTLEACRVGSEPRKPREARKGASFLHGKSGNSSLDPALSWVDHTWVISTELTGRTETPFRRREARRRVFRIAESHGN